ncbi:TRAP transporter small permease subunit [Frigidibacter albus]|uniref:TRAP transporter small permease protein n=1 Tax=Frigidibacter albus TaxID=1465486 RepID=A0A6L8VB58_9RHOB|nr:TRAP transporter small permease [Frigidibacter albus]MZQ87538.1 TRAP transporter small permease subunit [Frigidibacter albus]NBE29444.1 TRAP transporter small permease subunit [Frigidibacter albus]GGH44864.1 C4-dicarboxylate ABC transporter permease [Frigidibacter albus]
MNTFQTAAFGLSRFCAALAALMIVAMTLHILIEIVLRSFFATSTFVLDEMVGYCIAAATFLSLGYAFEHSSLVRVGLLVDRLSGRPRRALEAFCALATLAVMGQITWYLINTALRSHERGRVSSSVAEIPMWIPEALCAFGLAAFCLQVIAYLLRQITGAPGPVQVPDGDLQNDL